MGVDSRLDLVLVGRLHFLLSFRASLSLSISQLELQRLVAHLCEPHCHAMAGMAGNGFDSADLY